MNALLLTGAILTLGAAMAHSLLGEKVVLRRLFRAHPEEERRAADDPNTKRAMRVAWHSLTVALLGYAMLFLLGGVDRSVFGDAWPAVMRLLAATFTGLALLSVVMARGRHVGWMWYAATAATAWLSVG